MRSLHWIWQLSCGGFFSTCLGQRGRGGLPCPPAPVHARQCGPRPILLLCPSGLEVIMWPLQAAVRVTKPRHGGGPPHLGFWGRTGWVGDGGFERKRRPGLDVTEKDGCLKGCYAPGARGWLTRVYLSGNMAGLAEPGGAAAAQAEVSNRRSIMSPTCSTRYLMYFSGFLVKGTLPYLCRKAP